MADLEEILKALDNGDVINKKECSLLSRCLDSYSRFGISQVGIFYENIQMMEGVSWDRYCNSLAIEDLSIINYLRSKIFDVPKNGFLSIGGDKTHNDFKIGYELSKVITQYLSYEKTPEGGWTVNFDGPLSLSGEKIASINNVETDFKIGEKK